MVVTCRFELEPEEVQELKTITNKDFRFTTIEVSRDYAGRFEVIYPKPDVFPDKLHPSDIDNICLSIPNVPENVSDGFKKIAEEQRAETKRMADEGRFFELKDIASTHIKALQQEAQTHPQQNSQHHQQEQNFINQYSTKLSEIKSELQKLPSIQKKAHEYIVKCLPTFIYMSDYKAFKGTAQLNQVKERKDQNRLSEEDKTLLTIMELSGLTLDSEVAKANQVDREQRQYDLDDASATLTKEISDRWRQRRYEVQFRADGQLFYTFVKDERDKALIRLEERSKGFQWFFSFDLMFMYESRGTFRKCVILLDEPGLHLHPDAQRDLLKRMEQYARENTLLYTTHLPFMIDLQKPDRIRIISESPGGTIVTEDLTQSQPEAKFVLQAALGMSGSSSYLLSKRNLVVEGVDDYWVLTEMSRLLKKARKPFIPEDVFITPAGGASEAVYIATLMIGQKLDVIVLLDSDKAGEEARNKLIKGWLTKYHDQTTRIFNLGEVVGETKRDFCIEDMFTAEFYLGQIEETYRKEIEMAGIKLNLMGSEPFCRDAQKAFEQAGMKFNKGSVAKRIRNYLSQSEQASDLPETVIEKFSKVFEQIQKVFPNEQQK